MADLSLAHDFATARDAARRSGTFVNEGPGYANEHPVNRAIDMLLATESDDARWLRLAGEHMRANPETYDA